MHLRAADLRPLVVGEHVRLRMREGVGHVLIAQVERVDAGSHAERRKPRLDLRNCEGQRLGDRLAVVSGMHAGEQRIEIDGFMQLVATRPAQE
eukprot:13924120-Heterocapsa_arctica.AAC.1